MHRSFPSAALLLSLGLLAGWTTPSAGQADTRRLEEGLARHLQHARQEAGLDLLPRRAVLDSAAAVRARQLAALPPDHRRMAAPSDLQGALARVRSVAYQIAIEHLDMKKGYDDPLPYLTATWENSGLPWRTASGGTGDGFGLSVIETPDGWTLFVAVAVRDVVAYDDLGALERRAHEAVNRIRADRGLKPLELREDLSGVARDHARDMARRDYFEHRSPEGSLPSDRVKEAGIRFASLAENIQYNYNAPDPVGNAVRSWLESPGHRRNMLSRDFRHTGMGVAADPRGALCFTQLFLKPPGQ